jgi:hypothetical protein
MSVCRRESTLIRVTISPFPRTVNKYRNRKKKKRIQLILGFLEKPKRINSVMELWFLQSRLYMVFLLKKEDIFLTPLKTQWGNAM